MNFPSVLALRGHASVPRQGDSRRTYSVSPTNTRAVDDNGGGLTGQNPTSVNCIMIMHAGMVIAFVGSL